MCVNMSACTGRAMQYCLVFASNCFPVSVFKTNISLFEDMRLYFIKGSDGFLHQYVALMCSCVYPGKHVMTE